MCDCCSKHNHDCLKCGQPVKNNICTGCNKKESECTCPPKAKKGGGGCCN
ncbi:MAG: hypothetical protein JW709_00145 [Sedimentisphaerales bacterium]|nr:hypothetical protein [Sedimentisphaerales bacterium]